MFEVALSAFAMFFATIGPVEAAVLFASFCPRCDRAERLAVSLKAIGIATGIILFFALFGSEILEALGVTMPALQTAGGIILGLISLDIIFETPIAGSTITMPESDEARIKSSGEIAVFPLATPILAGPGAMSGAMVLMANASGQPWHQVAIVGALFAVMTITFILMLAAQEIREWIGLTAQKVVTRLLGILLAAIAVQSIFNGISGAGLFLRKL
jgi:multiple antibiotic resistance protein